MQFGREEHAASILMYRGGFLFFTLSDHLYPEWEVRDFNNDYRYVDLAYRPGGVKGGIEIQGYGPHARDLDV